MTTSFDFQVIHGMVMEFVLPLMPLTLPEVGCLELMPPGMELLKAIYSL